MVHVYMRTLGIQGALSAMTSGQIDVNMARQQHSLWAERELKRMEAELPAATGSGGMSDKKESTMDDEKFNMSLRKFLKQVGVTSQRELERVAREGAGKGKLKVKMVLTAAGTNLNHVVEEELDLG